MITNNIYHSLGTCEHSGECADAHQHPPAAGRTQTTQKKSNSLASLSIAHALAERGARTSVIEVLAGITQGQARAVIREVTGRDPRSGLLPVCSATLISSRRRHAEASIGAVVLDIFGAHNKHCISAEGIITAYDTYMMMNNDVHVAPKPLSITEMFILARDLRIGSTEIRKCQVCWSKWLYCSDATLYCECPHCVLLTDATCPQCHAPKSTRARLCHDCKSATYSSCAKSPAAGDDG